MQDRKYQWLLLVLNFKRVEMQLCDVKNYSRRSFITVIGFNSDDSK